MLEDDVTKWHFEDDENGDVFVVSPDGHYFCFGNMEGTSKCCFAAAEFIINRCNGVDKKMVDFVEETTVEIILFFVDLLAKLTHEEVSLEDARNDLVSQVRGSVVKSILYGQDERSDD